MAAMATTPPPPRHRATARVSRFLQARWRLLLGTTLCVLLVLFLPAGYRLVSRLLMGWDAGVAVYLILVIWMMRPPIPAACAARPRSRTTGGTPSPS